MHSMRSGARGDTPRLQALHNIIAWHRRPVRFDILGLADQNRAKMKNTLKEITGDFDEVYHIIHCADFLYGGHHVRFEIYQAIHSEEEKFDVVAYQMKDDVWVRWSECPWIACDSAETAMRQAVEFLKENEGLE